MLFSWSHQAAGPVRLDTAAHLCFDQINRRTPQGSVRCPYGRHTGPTREFSMFSYPVGPVQGPCGIGKGAAWPPLVTDTKGIWHNQKWQNSHTGVVCGCAGPRTVPHGLFTIEWGTHDFCSSLREQSVQGPGVWCDWGILLCPSHITLLGPLRTVPRLFWTKIARPRTAPVRRRTNFASPYRTHGVLMHAL